jgi:carbamoyl-phosphate synthase small subunit
MCPSKPRFHVVAYDYGVKRNILRMLAERGCRLTVVPAQTPAAEVLAMNPDGVFLSNGPGDPEPCDYAIAAIREILAKGVPTFGICLGHQLLALASGARTLKMKFGHHGANHPVKDLDSGQVLITSQNHGLPRTPRRCRPTCGRPTCPCSTAACRAWPAPMCRPSRSRGTRKPAPVPTTWPTCSIDSFR